MRRVRRAAPVAALAALAALAMCVTSCSRDGDAAATEPSSPPPATVSSAAPPTATAAPVPGDRDCYALDYDEAIAPTSTASPVDCRRGHTSMTFAVGELDTVVDGHLLAVDSDRVQAQVARECPDRLAGFLGGTVEDRRLSMLRAVWFTPTVEESDAGASWYRCDVIALAGDGALARLTGRLAGVLDRPDGRASYGICGTAEPGTPDFARVVCSRQHSWRALTTVPFAAGGYPGLDRVQSAGETPCRDAAREVADDTLSFRWGYEWPTAAQWRAGQQYGLCWAPA